MDENLSELKLTELKHTANEIRKSIINALVAAGSGHTAGPLGMADVFTLLYFHSMKHDPKNPTWEDRDRLILSNGHICPVLYATMAHAGYFPTTELTTLRKFGSRLQGHPHREFLPFVETSSGPLGSGLSQAVGMALAERINKGKNYQKYFYCLMGDGELNEGNIWEAVMLAGKEKLGSVIGIIDRNKIQIDGDTEDIMPLDPLDKKWEAFNWHVLSVDGHNFEALNDAVNQAKAMFDKPTVIIANTIPSKGVKAWEHDYKWHGKPPKKEEGEMAIKELEALEA
jgi:transketolase